MEHVYRNLLFVLATCSPFFTQSAPITVAGTLDTSFNPSGLTIMSDGSAVTLTGLGYAGSIIVDLGGSEEAYAANAFQFATQGDRIILGGRSSTGPADSSDNFALVVLTPTGLLDSSFNPSGLTITSDGTATKITGLGYPGSLIVDLGGGDRALSADTFRFTPQGDRIILSGFINTGPNPDNFALIVVTPTGSLDSSFNPSGLTIMSDGSATKIPGFGYPGSLIIDVGGGPDLSFSADAFDFAAQGDRILLGGASVTGGVSYFSVVVLTPTGTLDSSFNPSGLTVLSDGAATKLTGLGYPGSLLIDFGGGGSVQSVNSFNFITQGDRIILGGDTSTGPTGSMLNAALVVLTSTGLLDSSFNPSGLTITNTGASVDLGGYPGSLIVDLGGDDFTRSVDSFNFAAQGDRIIIGGASNAGGTFDFTLLAITPTGTLDNSFNPSGLTIMSNGSAAKLSGIGYPGALFIDLGGDDFALSVDAFRFNAQEDRIILGGFSRTGSITDFALVAVTDDGALDTSFNPSGLSITSTGTSVNLGGYAGSLLIDLGGGDYGQSVEAFNFTSQGERIIFGGVTDAGPNPANFALVVLHGVTRFPVPPVSLSPFIELPFIAMAAA